LIPVNRDSCCTVILRFLDFARAVLGMASHLYGHCNAKQGVCQIIRPHDTWEDALAYIGLGPSVEETEDRWLDGHEGFDHERGGDELLLALAQEKAGAELESQGFAKGQHSYAVWAREDTMDCAAAQITAVDTTALDMAMALEGGE
jgi:hypothetical protein